MQPWKVCTFRKPVLVRCSHVQTPPCYIIGTNPCGADLGKLIIVNANESSCTHLEKKVPLELIKERVTIGSSHGWIATLKDDGILRLQDDLIPVASDTDPKRIFAGSSCNSASLPNPNCDQRVHVHIFSWGWRLCCGCQVLGVSTQLLQTRSKQSPVDQHQNRSPLLLLLPSHVFQETWHVSHSRIWRPSHWIMGSWRLLAQTQVWQLAVSKASRADQFPTSASRFLLHERTLGGVNNHQWNVLD